MTEDRVFRGKLYTIGHLLFVVVCGFVTACWALMGPWAVVVAENTSFFIFSAFCLIWCINDVIGLMGFDDEKQQLLLCYSLFGTIILIFGLPYFIVILYKAIFGKIVVDGQEIHGTEISKFILVLMMFSGMIFSAISLKYSYQIYKEHSTSSTSQQNVPNESESNVQPSNEEVKAVIDSSEMEDKSKTKDMEVESKFEKAIYAKYRKTQNFLDN